MIMCVGTMKQPVQRSLSSYELFQSLSLVRLLSGFSIRDDCHNNSPLRNQNTVYGYFWPYDNSNRTLIDIIFGCLVELDRTSGRMAALYSLLMQILFLRLSIRFV